MDLTEAEYYTERQMPISVGSEAVNTTKPALRTWGCGVLLSVGLLVAGCVGVIPQAAREGIDPNFTFAELAANPEAARGRRVAFGGEILQVTVRAQETEIEVLHHPLRADDSPDLSAPSAGRFLVRRAGFLDPAVYPAGRLVTAVGAVEGAAERPLGEINYRYPVIRAELLYLWPRYQVVYPPTPYFYYPYPYPWFPPYYRYRYRFYPYRYGPPFWW